MRQLGNESRERKLADVVRVLLRGLSDLMARGTIQLEFFSCDYYQANIDVVLRYGNRGRGTRPVVRVGYRFFPFEIQPLYESAELQETIAASLEDLAVYPVAAREIPEGDVFWVSIPASRPISVPEERSR